MNLLAIASQCAERNRLEQNQHPTPARPNSDDLQDLAKGCDLVILPTKPDVDSLEPMLQTAKDIVDAPYRMLLTIVPPYPSREGETMRLDLEKANVPVFKQMISGT